MSKKAGATPLFIEELEMLKNRQVELIKKTGKLITLTEVTSEIVREGFESIKKKEYKGEA